MATGGVVVVVGERHISWSPILEWGEPRGGPRQSERVGDNWVQKTDKATLRGRAGLRVGEHTPLCLGEQSQGGQRIPEKALPSRR